MSDSSPLEEQRDFLLRSLEDLEQERAAGDVDEHDYLVLRDDYTARAAEVLRAIDAGRSRTGGRVRPARARLIAISCSVVAFALVAGVLVMQAAGRRDPGELITGGISQSATEKLNEAGRRAGTGELDAAIALYDEVLADDPANAEAMTYKGWLLTLTGESEVGLTTLLSAATAHPTYPDVHAFLAIVFYRSGLVEQAGRELDRLDALDPPPAIRELISGLRAKIDAARTTTTTSNQGL